MIVRAKRSLAFTLIEILIAIVVLVLGITGILALFPTAINSGNKTVEDSYSAAITQSVVDAIAVGLRESRYTYMDTSANPRLWTYFIFDHDGVLDRAPASPEIYGNVTEKLWTKDYCILLPRAMLDTEPPGGNTEGKDEPIFLYPIPRGPNSAVPYTPSGGALLPGADPEQRKPSFLALPASQVVDNLSKDPSENYWANTTTEETEALWISRIYRLGRYRDVLEPALPSGMVPGDIRLEYRGEDLVNPSGTGTNANTIALDPYPTYGFCFAIQRARVDTTGAGGEPDGMVSPGPGDPGDLLPDTNPPADAFSNSLYELRIMIFKNFNTDEANKLTPSSSPSSGLGVVVPKTNVPIKQFITLISI